MRFVTFHFIRIPRVFLLLALCLGVIAWAGYEISATRSVPLVIAVAQQPGETPEEAPELTYAQLGREAPDFTLVRLDGSRTALSSYRGRPVILYFWASWCSYCIEGMPKLQELREQYREHGLEVLAIDIMESAEKVRRAVQQHGFTLPVLLDETGQVTQQYLVKATPTYVVIDEYGVYRDVIVGVAREGALEGRLRPLL